MSFTVNGPDKKRVNIDRVIDNSRIFVGPNQPIGSDQLQQINSGIVNIIAKISRK